MKKIPLTQGKFAIVSDEDFEYLLQWKWYYNIGHAVHKEYVNGEQKEIYMHRVVLERKLGHSDFECAYHTNRNKLDNRKENLQAKTHREICRRNKNYTSNYSGVCRNKCAKKWRSYIYVNGKCIHLGHFDNEKEAAKTYDLAAIKHLGEHAVLNFPKTKE